MPPAAIFCTASSMERWLWLQSGGRAQGRVMGGLHGSAGRDASAREAGRTLAVVLPQRPFLLACLPAGPSPPGHHDLGTLAAHAPQQLCHAAAAGKRRGGEEVKGGRSRAGQGGAGHGAMGLAAQRLNACTAAGRPRALGRLAGPSNARHPRSRVVVGVGVGRCVVDGRGVAHILGPLALQHHVGAPHCRAQRAAEGGKITQSPICAALQQSRSDAQLHQGTAAAAPCTAAQPHSRPTQLHAVLVPLQWGCQGAEAKHWVRQRQGGEGGQQTGGRAGRGGWPADRRQCSRAPRAAPAPARSAGGSANP